MKTTIMIRYTVFIACLMFLAGCKKNKWKQPTDVSFVMDVNRSATLNGNLEFNGGHVVLQELSFDGEREQGDDVYFEKSYSALTVTLDENADITDLKFDIPQGTYSKIRVELEVGDAGPQSIVILGEYTNSNGDTYPLRLEMEEFELYTVMAKDDDGGNEIVLNKDFSAKAIVRFDPVFWFSDVTTTMLDTASTSTLNGVPTILINDANNDNILDLVDDRIDQKTEITFY